MKENSKFLTNFAKLFSLNVVLTLMAVLLVFVVTMFNWKFGNRYTNE